MNLETILTYRPKNMTVNRLYTDAGLVGSNGNCQLATYCFVHVHKTGTLETYLHHKSGLTKPFDRPIENNVAELAALLRGLKSLPDGWSGSIYCDNKNAIAWTKGIQRATKVPEVLLDYIDYTIARLGTLDFVHLDGHPTDAELCVGKGHRGNGVSVWNRMCDDYCNFERVKHHLITGDIKQAHKVQLMYNRLNKSDYDILILLGYKPRKIKLKNIEWK